MSERLEDQKALREEFLQWIGKQGVDSMVGAYVYKGEYRSGDGKILSVSFLGGQYSLSVASGKESWQLGLDPTTTTRQFLSYTKSHPSYLDFGYSGPANGEWAFIPGSRAEKSVTVNTVDVFSKTRELMTLLRSSQGALEELDT